MDLVAGLDEDEVPDFAAVRDRVLDNLVAFVRALRSAGADVPANAAVVGARALASVGFDDRDRARAALRAALVAREDDLETFEELFPTFWQGIEPEDARYTPPEQGAESPGAGYPIGGDPDDAASGAVQDVEADRIEASMAADDAPEEPPAGEAEALSPSVYSPAGRPEPVDVAATARGGDRVGEAVRRLTDAVASLRGRRWARSGGERVDARRALRESFSTGGTVLSVPRRERARSAVRAVILVDVSQSVLDTIDREFLVDVLRRVRRAWRDVRVFFFDTSVREVTEQFDAPTPAAALAALEEAEAEWGGGTRIGHALGTIRREHPNAVERDTLAFVISDGLEVGEIDELESGMAWLSRRAGGVLWLNPLAASPDYEPVCRGMAASLPYVDGLFAFAGPDDVAEIARQIARQGLGGPIGYEHDPRRAADA